MNRDNQKELPTNSRYDEATTHHHTRRFATARKEYTNDFRLTREKRTACREDDFRVFFEAHLCAAVLSLFCATALFLSALLFHKLSFCLYAICLAIPPRLLPPGSLLTHRILSIPPSSLFCGLSEFSLPHHRSRALIASQTLLLHFSGHF